MNRIAAKIVLLLLPLSTGCQLVVPSAQHAEEVCIGPSRQWAGQLAGMPEFVPYENSEAAPVAPRSKFHPLPTRPVFTPWKVESPIASIAEPVNPLMEGTRRTDDPADAETIDVPPGFESERSQRENLEPRKDGGGQRSDKSASSSRASFSRGNTVQPASAVSTRRRSRWSEVRVVE